MSQDKPLSPKINGAKFVFSIVAASYNQDLVESLLQKTITKLTQAQVSEKNIRILRVPGSGELPYVAHMTASSGEFDCVIVLGVVIAGDTPHHEIIGQSTALALQEIAIRSEVPVINGIVVTNNRAQAEQRCQGSLDRGTEFAEAALVMAQHRQNLGERLDALEDLDEPFDKN
jgi:6,7-dimethyl-8-ribityllumazine synthase